MIAAALLLVSAGVSQAQQTAGSSAAASSRQFSLDLGNVPQDDGVTAPVGVPSADSKAAAPPSQEPVIASSTASPSMPRNRQRCSIATRRLRN